MNNGDNFLSRGYLSDTKYSRTELVGILHCKLNTMHGELQTLKYDVIWSERPVLHRYML